MCAPTFPITELLDEDLCYFWLMRARWGPSAQPICPACGPIDTPPRRHQIEPNGPVEDYRCPRCRKVFNLFTGTIFTRTKRSCREIILILRGFAQGVSTNRLSKELETDYDMLLKLRHRYQAACVEQCFGRPGFAATETVESDEMYQNAGEKRYSPPQPGGSAAGAGEQDSGPRELGW